MTLVDWARILLLSLIWGASFILVEIALVSFGPMTIALARVLLAALTLIGYCRLVGIRVDWSWPLLCTFALMGFFNNAIPFSLIAWGQTEITAGYASILNATTPLFTVAVAHVWPAGERATPLKLAGIVAGIAGVAVMIGADALAGVASGVWGQVAVLGASASYGVGMVLGRWLTGIPPIYAAAGMSAAAALFLAPGALLIEAPFQQVPSLLVVGALVTLALVCSALAYIIYFKILASAGPTNLSLVTFLIPASAIFYGVVLLAEPIRPHQLAGLALILVGLALVDGRVARVFHRYAKAL